MWFELTGILCSKPPQTTFITFPTAPFWRLHQHLQHGFSLQAFLSWSAFAREGTGPHLLLLTAICFVNFSDISAALRSPVRSGEQSQALGNIHGMTTVLHTQSAFLLSRRWRAGVFPFTTSHSWSTKHFLELHFWKVKSSICLITGRVLCLLRAMWWWQQWHPQTREPHGLMFHRQPFQDLASFPLSLVGVGGANPAPVRILWCLWITGLFQLQRGHWLCLSWFAVVPSEVQVRVQVLLTSQ